MIDLLIIIKFFKLLGNFFLNREIYIYIKDYMPEKYLANYFGFTFKIGITSQIFLKLKVQNFLKI